MNRPTFLVCAFLFASAAFAQDPATGFPPYGSFQDGRFDAVNRQNLNVNFAIPTVSIPGRGIDSRFALVYDSLIWENSYGSWVPIPGPGGPTNWGWKTTSPVVQFKSYTRYCKTNSGGQLIMEPSQRYYSYVFIDAAGTRHPFNLNFYSDPTDCNFPTGPTTGYATDGSGYYLDATAPTSPTAYSTAGISFTNSGTITDPNGNFISKTVVSSTETDWTDTVGHTALKIISITNGTQYQFQDTTGTYQTTTVKYQTFNIKTNFGCSGVVEYTGTASLPIEIDLPNNQKYQFTYEATPNNSGYFTGRVQRVTLPTGGYYEYDYAGANDSINCSDGSVTSLTRKINDGTNTSTWQYVRTQSGSQWTTTATAPQLPYDLAANQSVFSFTGAAETSRIFYQGGQSGGTLLRTINTTWASNGTPASRVVILDDGSQSETDTSFDSYGNLLQLTEKDWGSGAPGPVLRTTTLTYLSTYSSQNILNRVTRKTVADRTGTTQFREDIGYDETALTACPSGVPHNNSSCVASGRANPTSITTYTNAAAASGAVTKSFAYDSLGNLTQAAVDCCQQKRWNYSATTNYAYPDAVVSGPAGGPQLTTSFAYNSSTGLVASVTDENNQVTSFSYDLMKRLTAVTRPDNAQVAYSYNDATPSVTVTAPLQATSTTQQIISYDGLGRPVTNTAQDSSGAISSTVKSQYDPIGRPYKVSNPYTGTPSTFYWTTTQFDALGRRRATILPDNNQTTYSYSGPSMTVSDPAGHQRKMKNDAPGRLVSVYEPDVTTNGNPLTIQTSYSYTVLDALASVTAVNGNQTRTFNYDGMSRLTSSTTPEAGQIQYQYNTFDLVTQRTDARNVITNYSYDTLNRLTQVSYNVGTTGVPSTPTVSFTYGTSPTQNNNGRLVTVSDGVGSETYSYDILGRTTQLQKVINGTTYPMGYAYNQAGELISITYPSGHVVQQSFDTIGRLSAISSGTTNYASAYIYNPAFEVTNLNYGNGVTASFGYSPDRLQLTSLTYAKGTQTLFSLSYGYAQNGSNNGQVTGITDLVDGGRSATYTYDALARLSAATTQGSPAYPQWGLSFSYDRYGNRTAQTVTVGTGPSNQVTIDATKNRISGTPYSYDANGNMLNDGLNTLAYDAENRLVTSSGSTYSYDGNGLRVVKVSGWTTTVYIFSGTKVIAEYQNGAAPASPTREYIYSGSQLLAKIEGGATQYYYADHVSVRVITDTSGNIIGQQGHYPFGESWYAASTTTKWQYTSYERDAESGNDYAMFRYDVNRLGRFSSPDPLAASTLNPQSLNRYAYTVNDPINLVDPLGLDCTDPETGETLPCPDVTSTTVSDTAGGSGDFDFSDVLAEIVEEFGTLHPFLGERQPREPQEPHPPAPLPSLGKPTCLQLFLDTFVHPEKGPLGPQLENIKDATQAALAAAAAAASAGGAQAFNAALERGRSLAAAAGAAGITTVPLRSTVFKALLSRAQSLFSFAEEATSEIVAGEAGLAAGDLLLLNALLAEKQAVEGGQCIPEGQAIRVILGK